MELKLNSEWRETIAFDAWTGRVKPTGYEWVYRDVSDGGVIRTVCKSNIHYLQGIGTTIFGDSYNLGSIMTRSSKTNKY